MFSAPAKLGNASFLLRIVFYLVLGSTWAIQSVSREVRPSEHGLSFQKEPEAVPPAMKSFFKGSATSSSSEPFPRVTKNSSDSDGFWSPDTFGHVRKGESHVRTVMLVASVACGVGGLVLLVAAGLVYVLLTRRNKK